MEEARKEARLKDFKEQRAWRWSILGLRSRSRCIKLLLNFVLIYKFVLDASYINLCILKGICMTRALILFDNMLPLLSYINFELYMHASH